MKKSTSIVKEGQEAFTKGVKICPYEKGDSGRTSWYIGWYSAQIGKNLEHIFKKYNIDWP